MTDEDRPTKKARVEEAEPEPEPEPETETVVVVVEDVSSESENGEAEEESKIEIPSETVAATLARECNICMQQEPTVTLLETHNCPQCKPSAWRICELCDLQFLSRNCPVCTHEYKELMLHRVPGMVKFPIKFDEFTDARRRCLVTLTARYFFEIVCSSNTAVWSPRSQRIYFSLPMDMSKPVADMQFILSSIPITAEKIEEGGTKFRFLSSVWDEIEKEIETGEAESFSGVNAREASRWIARLLEEDEAVALTPISPEEWTNIQQDFDSAFNEQPQQQQQGTETAGSQSSQKE